MVPADIRIVGRKCGHPGHASSCATMRPRRLPSWVAWCPQCGHRSGSARRRLQLLDLPPELLREVARTLLELDVRATMWFLRTCKTLAAQVQSVLSERRAADASRLQFDTNCGGQVSADRKSFFIFKRVGGFAVPYVRGNVFEPEWNPWAAAHALPATGTFIWRVRLDVATSVVWVGVCTAEHTQAWALSMHSGVLDRFVGTVRGCPSLKDDLPGTIKFTRAQLTSSIRHGSRRPPAGFPDGDGTPVFPRFRSVPTEGCTVDVQWDAAAGVLAFRLGGERVDALAGFPPGAALRPFVMMRADRDRVTMMTGDLSMLGVA